LSYSWKSDDLLARAGLKNCCTRIGHTNPALRNTPLVSPSIGFQPWAMLLQLGTTCLSYIVGAGLIGGFTEKQCRGSKEPLPVTPVPSPGMCTVLRPTHCLCMRSTISIDDAVAFKVASILRAGFRASYASVAQTTNPKAREFRIPPAPPHEGRVAPQTSNPRSASVPWSCISGLAQLCMLPSIGPQNMSLSAGRCCCCCVRPSSNRTMIA